VLNKFISGLIFGLGFAISVIIVSLLSFTFLAPKIAHTDTDSIVTSPTSATTDGNSKIGKNFNDLSVEEKIENSTAIIVTEVSKGSDGEYKAKVSDILMIKDGVSLYYKKGDIYDDHMDYKSYYPDESTIPKGLIIFMSGNPAQMRYSVSYSGDRVDSLGGIPMALFKEKCGT
jgi:hypothetical protein